MHDYLVKLGDAQQEAAISDGGNSGKIILDLCGGSGSWSRWYARRGYDVRLITKPYYDIMEYHPPVEVHGILCDPPVCDMTPRDVTADKRRREWESGISVIRACMRVIEETVCKWWCIQNPSGNLRQYLGKPLETFQPWEYGDPWTRKTDLYGRFKMPVRFYKRWEDVPARIPELYIRKGREIPSFCLQKKEAIAYIPGLQWFEPATDAEFRGLTPPGFANAFTLWNP